MVLALTNLRRHFALEYSLIYLFVNTIMNLKILLLTKTKQKSIIFELN